MTIVIADRLTGVVLMLGTDLRHSLFKDTLAKVILNQSVLALFAYFWHRVVYLFFDLWHGVNHLFRDFFLKSWHVVKTTSQYFLLFHKLLLFTACISNLFFKMNLQVHFSFRPTKHPDRHIKFFTLSHAQTYT